MQMGYAKFGCRLRSLYLISLNFEICLLVRVNNNRPILTPSTVLRLQIYLIFSLFSRADL